MTTIISDLERYGKTMSVRISELRDSAFRGRILREFADQEKIDDPGLKQLVESIKENGMMVPIIVRQVNGQNGYEIVDGHRRLAACKILERDNIEVLMRNYQDHEAQVFSVIGNLHRLNPGPIEMAIACQRILDKGFFKCKKELSIALNKDETYVGDLLNLVAMDKRIIEDLVKNKSINDLRILRLIRKAHQATGNRSDLQWEMYQRVIRERMTRAQLQKELSHPKKAPNEYPSFRQFENMINITFPKSWDSAQKEKVFEQLRSKFGIKTLPNNSTNMPGVHHLPDKSRLRKDQDGQFELFGNK